MQERAQRAPHVAAERVLVQEAPLPALRVVRRRRRHAARVLQLQASTLLLLRLRLSNVALRV